MKTAAYALPAVGVVMAMVSCTNSVSGTDDLSRGTDPEYVRHVEEWRLQHEADYTRDFVPLAGLFFLEAGANEAGSAPSSRVRLPDRMPASIGRFHKQENHVRFEPHPDAQVSVNGQPVTGPIDLRPDSEEVVDELAIGDIALWVHMSGDRYTVRMSDPQGDVARDFAGFRWFAIDERYRVVGTLIRDEEAREVQIPSLTGDDQTYTTEGVVEFTLNGEPLRLRPMTTRPGRLFFIFRDATSGTDTYEAARFLYADVRDDDTTVLDFNQAYNPPCAFNPFTTCPLPPPENRLTIPVRAGELNYLHPVRLP